MDGETLPQPDCEYIVVGSGPGGGTVAARLAEAGGSVILLEAGGDPRELQGGDPLKPETNRLPLDYDVPAFHAFASENEAIKWDFFVRHYSDESQQKLDWKYVREIDGGQAGGVLYPRAGTLGGCSAHNAQIFVYPDNADWQRIADITGDASWAPDHMRVLFEHLENCHHRPLRRWIGKLGLNPTQHGWAGWLHTEKAIPIAAVLKRDLFRTLRDCVEKELASSGHVVKRLGWFLESWGDPNDYRIVQDEQARVGVRYLPLTTRKHARMGSRERVLEAASKHANLKIQLHTLVSNVLFDAGNRAIGVEYLRGERLYRASPRANEEPGELRRLYASKEVILAGGAFNTPQLLMLSGIGPREELERYGIHVRVHLPGVGKNLQDRYEIAVVNRMNVPRWEVYEDVQFVPGDPQFREWQAFRSGIYATNGSVLSVFKRSPLSQGPPDLICMALLTKFQGYYPNYSQSLAKDLNYLTWVVLKAHTRNCAGEITLRSPDARDVPYVNFHYFAEGGDEDLKAVIDGIRFVRKLTSKLKESRAMVEECPGEEKQSDEDLASFVRRNAWGHHASCSAIGPVLQSDFRVHGTLNLRVVDASVFPRIPGSFIASAVYMIGEKAGQVILNAWRG